MKEAVYTQIIDLRPWTRVSVKVFVHSVSNPVYSSQNVQVCDKNAYLLQLQNPEEVLKGSVVQMNLLEAIAKVGDSTGCLDLCLKNTHIKEAVPYSIMSLENCHVRINKKRMVLESDAFTVFKTLERFNSS